MEDTCQNIFWVNEKLLKMPTVHELINALSEFKAERTVAGLYWKPCL